MGLDMTQDLVLAHYGVKGMRWGQRKSGKRQPVTGTTRYKTPPKKLTDKELRRRIERLRNEDTYNQLNAPTRTRGQKAAASLIEQVGKQAVSTLATGAVVYGAKKAIDRRFGEGTSDKIYAKKKGQTKDAVKDLLKNR